MIQLGLHGFLDTGVFQALQGAVFGGPDSQWGALEDFSGVFPRDSHELFRGNHLVDQSEVKGLPGIDKLGRSKQHQQQLKEVKIRPKIEKHDLDVKIRNARRFLGDHHKVKVTMNFRGREVTHSGIGRDILIRVADELADVANVETPPRMEGRHMLMLLAPKPSTGAKKAKPTADPEKAKG